MAKANGKSLKQILGALITLGFIIGVFTMLISLGVKAIFFGNVETILPSPSPRPVVSCPPDFQSYSKLIENADNTVKLIDGKKSMFARNRKFINTRIILAKTETAKSKIRCGYLYVSAGTDKGALVPQWEDVVISLNDNGGHLVPDNAIWVNNGALSSQYLYQLDNIQYWDTYLRNNIVKNDWASLLNATNDIKFVIQLNTTNTTGFVDQVYVAYKCWDPTTGEENNSCKMEVTSILDTESSSPDLKR